MSDFSEAKNVKCPYCKTVFCDCEGPLCDCMTEEAFCLECDESFTLDMADELDWQCECGGHIKEN